MQVAAGLDCKNYHCWLNLLPLKLAGMSVDHHYKISQELHPWFVLWCVMFPFAFKEEPDWGFFFFFFFSAFCFPITTWDILGEDWVNNRDNLPLGSWKSLRFEGTLPGSLCAAFGMDSVPILASLGIYFLSYDYSCLVCCSASCVFVSVCQLR